MASLEIPSRPPPQPIHPSSSGPSVSAYRMESRHHDEHLNPRFFIGPMPEKVLPDPEILSSNKKGKKHANLLRGLDDSEQDDVQLAQIIKENAFAFFLHQGGREEDWGEDKERCVRREMARRWRESTWVILMKNRREEKQKRIPNRWMGSSFEIGEIAGINVISEAAAVRSLVSSTTSFQSSCNETTVPYLPLDAAISQISSPSNPSERPEASRVLSSGQQTFVTAPSEPQPSSSQAKIDVEVETQHTHSPTFSGDPRTSSQTPLLSPPSLPALNSSRSDRQETPRRPIIKLPSLVRGDPPKDKGKGKKVHYDLSPVTLTSNGPREPAPPSEVLQRSGEEVQDTSAGAMSASVDVTDLQWGDVVMRDRMLVRIFSSQLSALPRFFDEHKHRQTRKLYYEDWQEFMIVWRMDRIEFYENYTMPGEEWVRGHKNLSYIIPLKSGRTKLSIYSFVDLTFCITCPPTSRRYNPTTRKWQIHISKEGTFVYIFKIKCRSRAYDWTWQLWRHLGGQLPPTISVRNPRVDSKVNIDMPAVDTAEVYKVFTRDNVIALCYENLRSVQDWKHIIEKQVAQGRVLELAWRRETHLDWIWLDDDVDGKRRNWAVLCGLVLKESTVPAHLEIRLGEHSPRFLFLKNGTRLEEPPAVEGYVDRIKPFGQARQSIYLSVHDGNLFTLIPARANPPTPIGPFPLTRSTTEHYSESLRQSEVRRGARQILNASGVADLRKVLVVRRASHPVIQHQHNLKEEPEDENWVHTWSEGEVSAEDDEDEGGDGMLQKVTAEDKPKLRMRRSFELFFKNGHVVRFEAYSCRYAIEWVQRLRELVHFWKLRHRNDARDEMDLAQALRPRVTPKTYQEKDRVIYPEPPPDLSSPMPALGLLYNWCVLEGCKPIVRGGKLFMRQGLRGQYKLVQMFIVSESIVQFHIKPNNSLSRSEAKRINLMDAYVCSGYFAAQALPSGQYNANANNEARRYQDGLEANDPEEDRLFMIWYKSHTKSQEMATKDASDASLASSPPAPPLDARKKKMAVFRTRSKLERDAWCWALNCEIEKIARTRRDRETKMRETGGLMNL
ncbi:hypothetical protein E1B28_012485 [Marasmius oreades]|uniref:PH domain-containing protein n=1 Tax=Marasmius oreades TaxID=181124 RepID=A0A9P7RRU3_9AGAR|nr:uncharacterized protein E1B28_012485 [Marasmius oreades]KAG7088497.1 hypothetical protein E1B28_012485 [Marasmius oreades]